MPSTRRGTPADTGSAYDAYVLVHPEIYPSNDQSVIHHDIDALADELPALLDGFDDRLAQEVARAAGTCDRRILVDDMTVGEMLVDRCPHDLWPLVQERVDGEDVSGYNAALTILLQHGEVLPDISGAGWEYVLAEPHHESLIVPLVAPGMRVLLAGFSRHDCVRRAVGLLRTAGCVVTYHEKATLPLSRTAVAAWARSLADDGPHDHHMVWRHTVRTSKTNT